MMFRNHVRLAVIVLCFAYMIVQSIVTGDVAGMIIFTGVLAGYLGVATILLIRYRRDCRDGWDT
jgi:hypothetical protein